MGMPDSSRREGIPSSNLRPTCLLFGKVHSHGGYQLILGQVDSLLQGKAGLDRLPLPLRGASDRNKFHETQRGKPSCDGNVDRGCRRVLVQNTIGEGRCGLTTDSGSKSGYKSAAEALTGDHREEVCSRAVRQQPCHGHNYALHQGRETRDHTGIDQWNVGCRIRECTG